MKGSARLVVAAALLPFIVVAVASVAGVWAAAAGSPWWGPRDETLPEAIILEDYGEAARLIALGANPNQRGSVRAGLAGPDQEVLTPLEAAVAAGESDLVRLLQDMGAAPDAEEVRTLRCYADAIRSRVRDQLVAWSQEPWPDCRTVVLPTDR